MTLKRGEVVLVPFPYAELTATKARPALIVSSPAFTFC
jgi:mRNA-degrading endonuclease toxin of MazEF toxin-antitoxin module